MRTKMIPGGFTVRPPQMDDLEAVVQLINTCEIALDGTSETTLADIRTAWLTPEFNKETDFRLVFSPEEKLVAASDVHHRQHVKLYMDAWVHPEYRGRGIGSYLLQIGEERALQHFPAATPGARVTLTAGVDSKDIDAQHLLQSAGFELVRRFWRMGIELHETPPAAQWSTGIVVRSMDPGMERAVFEADEEAFKDHWGYMSRTFEQWSHWSLKSEGFDASLWFLAMDGNEIAGFALCQDEKAQGGWVHDLAVRRAWRRKGIGLALLYHAFAEFYRRGIPNVYLGVDAQSLTGATRLYERAGMHVVKESQRYEKELRAGKELSTQFVEV